MRNAVIVCFAILLTCTAATGSVDKQKLEQIFGGSGCAHDCSETTTGIACGTLNARPCNQTYAECSYNAEPGGPVECRTGSDGCHARPLNGCASASGTACRGC